MQRKVTYNDKTKTHESTILSQPYVISIRSNMNWIEMYDEIASQVIRHVKVPGESNRAKYKTNANDTFKDSFRQ
jgi:hypothetical protein